MTLDNVGAKFREASWLIAKRSTVAAGQALKASSIRIAAVFCPQLANTLRSGHASA